MKLRQSMEILRNRGIVFALLILFLSFFIYSQEEGLPQIEVEKAADNIYMMAGGYGNVCFSVGKDGVLLVDTKHGIYTDIVKTEISKISDHPIRLVINTHWHSDHVGGNEKMRKLGVVIIAQEKVRTRMSKDNYNEYFKERTPAAPLEALPQITFKKDLTLHFNGETVYILHLPGHTEGDAVVYFQKANVIHTGDIYFNRFLQTPDLTAGGSIEFIIEAIGKILPMIDDKTVVIPGHGPMANKTELSKYRDMLKEVWGQVKEQIKAGKTLEQVVASKPIKKYDGYWLNRRFTPDDFIRLVYADLMQRLKTKVTE